METTTKTPTPFLSILTGLKTGEEAQFLIEEMGSVKTTAYTLKKKKVASFKTRTTDDHIFAKRIK